MNAEQYRDFCLSLPNSEESFPFDEDTLVYKVGGKVFSIAGLERMPFQFVVKCNPERSIELRAQYSFVVPGFHMNKTHWNTVICESGVSLSFFQEQILHSYRLIRESLPKKVLAELLPFE